MAIRRCRNSVRGSKLWGNQLEPHISQIHKIGDWQKDILPSLSILEIPFKVICKAAIHIYTGSTLVRYFDTSIFCYQCQSVRTSIFVAGYLRFTMYMYTVYIILHNNIQIHVPVFFNGKDFSVIPCPKVPMYQYIPGSFSFYWTPFFLLGPHSLERTRFLEKPNKFSLGIGDRRWATYNRIPS